MASIVILSGSPSSTSRTAAVLDLLANRLSGQGHDVRVLPLRSLPAGPLLAADTAHPEIAGAANAVADARGVIVASPVYKAAYSGLLKSFLDLLPQHALAGKTVLPLVTGGTTAHVLAVDYALRPVLSSMGAHVGQGYFLLDRFISVSDHGVATIGPEAERPLHGIVDAFAESLDVFRPTAVAI